MFEVEVHRFTQLQIKRGLQMPGNPRELITTAERRFPVRIRIAVPPAGLGQRYTQITAWLEENCGGRRVGYHAFGNAWRAERCRLDLLRRCDAGERVCFPMVCRGEGRDSRRRVPGARG